MSQMFPRSANTIARLSLIGFALAIPLFVSLWVMYDQSAANTRIGVVHEQPIPFSHLIHAGRLSLDCRYCHISVENSPFAGIPTTQQCMNCHSQVAQDLPGVEVVVASRQSGSLIDWQRVHNLPDYVYFDHSIHINKGVACETCHGRVDEMSILYQVTPMTMEWCLNCHHDPGQFIRPSADVTVMGWSASSSQPVSGETLAQEYGIETRHLTNCDVCHR